MNHSLPDWNIDGDLQTSLKKLKGPDHGLVELLWQNGQLVFHGQPHRKPGVNTSESNNVQKHDQPALAACGSVGNSNNLIQDDETASWIQYPVDDSFEKEFCSNFFSGIPSSNPMEADKPIREFGEDKYAKFGSSYGNQDVPSSQNSQFTPNPMPPPRFQHPKLGGLGKNVSFSQSAAPVLGADLESSNAKFGGKGLSNMAQAEVRECSSMTVGSSHCGSNQVPTNDTYISPASTSGVGAMGLSTGHLKDDARKAIPQRVRGDTEMLDQALTSSSGGSGTSYGRTYNQSTSGIEIQKRKGRDGEDSECQSEAAELDSPARNKSAQPSRTARRSRAAEVHNLSERRRRDRINEKMKALQELIPHSNKSDKASMLDEAIEYLKSLQLQLQMMWMGSGMAPMMLPGAQNYISRMGMGMGPPPLPAIHNPMHSPRVSLVDQAISMAPTPNQAAICPTPVLNPLNYQTQMQNSNFAEQYACYMALHQMQNASQQPMNIFNFGLGTGQQGHVMAQTPPVGNNGSSSSGRTTADETSIRKSG